MTMVNGRPAMVVFLDRKFRPVDESVAELVKVVFLDKQGGVVFLVPQEDG